VFPPLPFSLPEIPSSVLSVLGVLGFLVVNFLSREWFYLLLDWFLGSNSVWVRVVGEVISLFDAFVKSWGVYFLFSLIGGPAFLPAFLTISPLGLVLPLTVVLFELRYWIYPTALKGFSTKSILDDGTFFVDLLARVAGLYQVVVM